MVLAHHARMRFLVMLTLLFAACDSNDNGGQPDLAIVGTCPSATDCNPGDQCTYPGFEPTMCICVSPERLSCCSGGAGADCNDARQGEVCCGHISPGGSCGNGCQCVQNHWSCPDGGV